MLAEPCRQRHGTRESLRPPHARVAFRVRASLENVCAIRRQDEDVQIPDKFRCRLAKILPRYLRTQCDCSDNQSSALGTAAEMHDDARGRMPLPPRIDAHVGRTTTMRLFKIAVIDATDRTDEILYGFPLGSWMRAEARVPKMR